jgi:N-acetylneuraminate lyase
MKTFQGILPALMTPFDSAGQVSEARLRKMVDYSLKVGVDGFYLCGGGGEGLLLTVEERMRVLEIAVEQAAGRATIIAHVGAFQIPDTLVLARHAREAGADAVASIPPAYFYYPRLTGLVRFYQQLAEASELPVLAYNIPGRLPLNLDVKTFEQLLQIPGVIGLKDSSGDLYQISLMNTINDGNITVFNGSDQVLFFSLMAGCKGGIGSTYPVMMDLFVALYRAFVRKDFETALRVQRKINHFIYEILSFDEPLGAVKQVLKWIDLDAGDPRPPGEPLSPEQASQLKVRLEHIGFFDQERTPL